MLGGIRVDEEEVQCSLSRTEFLVLHEALQQAKHTDLRHIDLDPKEVLVVSTRDLGVLQVKMDFIRKKLLQKGNS